MNRIWKFLRSLDWRVLLALPVLSLLLGVANNLRVPEDQKVKWSGERLEEVKIEEVAVPEVMPGVWTTNFVAATNAAEAAHLPVVVVSLTPGCSSCKRLHREILIEEVKAWQKNLGWYFVMVSSDVAREASKFVRNTPVQHKNPPYVGVYWTRADGTCAMRNFTAKSGHMGVSAEPSLVREWMHAIEASVPGAPGVSFVPSHDMGVQIAVKAESENWGMGRITMTPPVDVIHKGEKVVLRAKPGAGSVFVGWRYPDGRVEQGEGQLTLDDHSQTGTYRAIFRRPKRAAQGGTLKKGKKEE